MKIKQNENTNTRGTKASVIYFFSVAKIIAVTLLNLFISVRYLRRDDLEKNQIVDVLASVS